VRPPRLRCESGKTHRTTLEIDVSAFEGAQRPERADIREKLADRYEVVTCVPVILEPRSR